MDPKWHIAFCNVTYTEYAGVTYRDYYGSGEVMLETQLAAKEYAETRFGVGRWINPVVEMPSCSFASLFGMKTVTPEDDDELPYLDTSQPVITDVSQADRIVMGDPRTTGLMAKKWEIYQYYQSKGYKVGFGGAGGNIISAAVELSNSAIFSGMLENPEGARQVLQRVVEAEEALVKFDLSLRGADYSGFGYTGDDFSGLLSPAMYREFAVPCYLRLYGDNTSRFMHSELLRAEHLRIARDEAGITDFHGAGSVLLTLQEQYEIMGQSFWTQLTPQEMLEFTPAQIHERIKEFANCGCHCVQLYPGRGTPERNMEAAIAACQRECPGGPA